ALVAAGGSESGRRGGGGAGARGESAVRAGLRKELAGATAELAAHAARVSELEAQVAARANEIARLEDDVASARRESAELEARERAKNGEPARRVAEMGARLQAFEAGLHVEEQRLAGIEGALEQASTLLARLEERQPGEQRLRELAARLGAVRREIADYRERVEWLTPDEIRRLLEEVLAVVESLSPEESP